MFDISFAELMLVAVVALLVIGPNRLPKVARTLGAYTGRLQRYISQVKEEVNREINFEELQEMQREIQSGVDGAKASIRDGLNEAKQTVEEVEHAVVDAESAQPKSVKKAAAKTRSVKKSASTKKPAATKRVTKRKTSSKKTAKVVEKAQ